ncbi:MAG: hypothetical protein OEM49_11985 [Myxococcales bacterium]|nr:hypothetical protein [Myxococcales bacterium]MDH5306129.1 hypothetical protein [Myxococcales bacterium]MDH5565538.1 hypothetical protein [Myxococcales bacterium]
MTLDFGKKLRGVGALLACASLAGSLAGAQPAAGQEAAAEAARGSTTAVGDAGPSEAKPLTAAEALELARQALEEAEGRKVAADAAYARMRRRNEPRGAAREEIVRERKEARMAYEAARAAYEAARERASMRR